MAQEFFVNNVKKYVDVDLKPRFECSIHGKQTVIVKPFDSDSKRKVMQTQIIMVLEDLTILSHMEQELPNLPEHLISPLVFIRFVELDLQFSV